MCGGSPGQIFFRILAKKHFENFFWRFLATFLKKKIKDFLDEKDEILLRKNVSLHLRNFFWKRKLFFIEKIYILPNIEFETKKF